MSKDSKVIQRGVNVQDNDLAVPAGTLQHAVNVDFYRNGVASKRTGFESMYNGIPQYEVDASYNPSDAQSSPVQRNIWELFSRDRPMMNTNGLVFAYDEAQDYWFSVPANLPHRFTFFGNSGSVCASGYGNAVSVATDLSRVSPFILQQTSSGYTNLVGAICNDASSAKIATTGSGGTMARFRRPADVVFVNNGVVDPSIVVSDDTAIRNGATGAVIAGQILTPGSANGTGAAASFSGASWMATDGSDVVWVADNANQIRRVVISTGVVTLFAGSVTAGDTDGTGSAARFRNITGIAYDGSANLYVTEGAGAHRVRRVTVPGAVVSIFAGSLTPTPGYQDATGTAARFNTPTGIELVNGTYYIGDSGNNRIRTMTSGAVVGTLNNVSGVASSDGLVGGLVSTAITPGVVVRGQYVTSGASSVSSRYPQGSYLAIECTPTVSTGSLDCGLVGVTSGAQASAQHVYHYTRCPATYATQTTGPNKLDSFGPNAYSYTDSRAVDVGGGMAMTTCARPRAIDIWTKLATTDTMPRLRDMGIWTPEAPAVAVSTATGTAFANNTAWAYRYITGLKLPDGRITTSAPSERVILTNTSGAVKNGSITCYPSPGLPYDGMPFVQLYRTKTVASTIDPGDTMFLCYETPLTYGQGAVIEDLLPDANLGAELYTNATADGPQFASLAPPQFATEIASFQQQMVLGNYIPQATVRVKVLGTSPLVAGTSNITITQGPTQAFAAAYYAGATLVLTAISGATSPNTNQFQIASGGTAAQNAAQTARNIVACINRGPDAYFFQAFYDENDPGTFVVTSLFPGASRTQVTTRITGKTLTQSSVTFSTNASSAFFTVAANIATRTQNAAIYSDVKIYDSMPVIYSFEVGPNTEAIQRMLPIADRLLTVKDDSVWSIDQSFGSQIYDNAISCSFPNSFSKLNNQWIGLFTRGFCSLNSSQAVAIGRAVDRDVTAQLVGSVTAPVNFVSSAAIDVYGNYLCTVNDRTFVYNALAQAWSEWQINSMVRQAVANEGTTIPGGGIGRLSGMQTVGAFRDCFIATQDLSRAVFRQRDYRRSINPIFGPFWYQNYSDAAYSFSGTMAADGKTITVSAFSPTTNPGNAPPARWLVPNGAGSGVAGSQYNAAQFPWILRISGVDYQGYVVATSETVPTSAVTITLTLPSSIPAGPVTVTGYAPILVRAQYAPTVRPGVNNQFGDVLVTLERMLGGPLAARFFNRRDQGYSFITATGSYLDSYGYTRISQMASNSPAFAGQIFYDDEVRIPTASERAVDQQLVVELWEGASWQPLAIKSVAVDDREMGNGKVKQ